MNEVKTEKLTAEDVSKWFAFYLKHKQKIWGIALLILGGAGFNIDRIAEALPDVYHIKSLRDRITAVEADVEILKEKNGLSSTVPPTLPTPSDDGSDITVSRPKK